MNGVILKEIENRIIRAKDIALYCHTKPDTDALGSMLALYVALKNMGKNAVVYCDSPVPDKYKCLFKSEDIVFPQKRAHELAISLDSSSIDRLGQCKKSFLSAKSQIAIDHHKSFEKFASICYVDDNASSCAEIVFELLRDLNAIDDKIAKLLFCGIVTDSGCFSYSNVTKRTHEIACELLAYDFDASGAIYDVYRSISFDKFNLKRRALAKAKFFEDNQIAIICFSTQDFDDTHTTSDDTEGIVSELIDIKDVKVAYAVSQVGERNFKMSIRTKDPVDASDIAMTFGGGGHKNAAGCRVNGYLEDIEEKLVKLAKDRI